MVPLSLTLNDTDFQVTIFLKLNIGKRQLWRQSYCCTRGNYT